MRDNEQRIFDESRRVSQEKPEGVAVHCTVCGRTKKPVGRDSRDNSFCRADECEGYRLEPYAGHLWPGEVDAGY